MTSYGTCGTVPVGVVCRCVCIVCEGEGVSQSVSMKLIEVISLNVNTLSLQRCACACEFLTALTFYIYLFHIQKTHFTGIITNSTGGRCVSRTTPTTCSPLHQRAPTSPMCGLAPSRDPDSLSSSSTLVLQQQTSRAMKRASKQRVLCQTRAMRYVGVQFATCKQCS